MCRRCEKQVISRGIKESDLQYLPFKWVKWKCIVPNCKGGARNKDFGNDPYYFDPTKRRHNEKKQTWRGGWFNASDHFYMCSRHGKDWNRIVEMLKHRFTPEYFLSMIKPITFNKKNHDFRKHKIKI